MNCCSVFPCDFFMIFSKIIFVDFFFNIELIKNYNYNKGKSYEESIVVFLTKHCGLLQYFSKRFFYFILLGKTLQFSSQNIVNFYNVFPHGFVFLPKLSLLAFFLILSWQRIQFCNFFCFLLTEKLNHVVKILYLSSQNTVECYKLFYSVSKFLITNTTFFSVMKYWLHHTLSSAAILTVNWSRHCTEIPV